jgi:anti-sigma factor ChrR (cupin superfamily)
MKKMMTSLVVALTLSSSMAFAANKLTVLSPSDLQWFPATDLKGAEVAIVSGNPEKKEPFIARVKLPANFQIPVHTHHINEYDTVISGALYVGTGAKFDADNGEKISAGSFVLIPAKLQHYIWTKEETVLQVNGMGPWGMVYKKKA